MTFLLFFLWFSFFFPITFVSFFLSFSFFNILPFSCTIFCSSLFFLFISTFSFLSLFSPLFPVLYSPHFLSTPPLSSFLFVSFYLSLVFLSFSFFFSYLFSCFLLSWFSPSFLLLLPHISMSVSLCLSVSLKTLCPLITNVLRILLPYFFSVPFSLCIDWFLSFFFIFSF